MAMANAMEFSVAAAIRGDDSKGFNLGNNQHLHFTKFAWGVREGNRVNGFAYKTVMLILKPLTTRFKHLQWQNQALYLPSTRDSAMPAVIWQLLKHY